MNGDTLLPTDTPAGIEQIDGDEFEYPYRVTDHHGETIAKDLDTVPALLNQEQMDNLAAHIEDVLDEEGVESYQNQVIASVLRDLPDTEYGRGGTPDWLHQPGNGGEDGV